MEALQAAQVKDEAAVFVFHDLHSFLGDEMRPAEPSLLRVVREISNEFKVSAHPKTLIILAPKLVLPIEIEKEVSVLDFPLPTEQEITASLSEMIEANRKSGRIEILIGPQDQERFAQAALGLTLSEAENAFARAMVNDGKLDISDIDVILEEKRQTIRKSGLLEFVNSDLDLNDVGGLENLKRWLQRRNGSWREEAKQFGLPAPKGVLVTGVPGCGKSLTAKGMAASWELPLLRLDIGKIFSGLVGSSEQNMRQAIRTSEALAPCVLWIDEIEKGFSGAGGEGDSGTSSRVFGSFLTWMQEKIAPYLSSLPQTTLTNSPQSFSAKAGLMRFSLWTCRPMLNAEKFGKFNLVKESPLRFMTEKRSWKRESANVYPNSQRDTRALK
jgi:SpoVK/Ycf46/Vps4 family AAA+-type ATPase